MLKLSPDEAALLKAVCADRDADLPRLVYADWLDDHSRPERAEFIRVQMQAVRHPGDHANYHLWPRSNELLATHRDRWVRELPKWAVSDHPTTFTRGFIEAFAVPAATFARHGPQLLDRTPVRRLTLRAAAKVVGELVICPWLREVPTLDLSGSPLGDDGGLTLSGAGWLSGILRLHLDYCELGDRTARALANSRHLAGLELLNLSGNRLSVGGVEALLASPFLVGCHFRLGGNSHLLQDHHAVRRLLGPRGTL